ncbi:MAG: retropepsin-like domain-containing protein [Bacillaceae bacterium]|nr:retropepsin-like domain-containing protein [Bacillaceae bacterium]
MKITYKYGLLLVDIELTFNGVSKVIKNMVVDTGAAKTLISQDVVEDINLHVDLHDKIVTYFGVGGKEHAFRKKIDKIAVGHFSVENVEIDFNDFGYDDINGLLGLDLLMELGLTLDLVQLELFRNN